MSSSGANGVSGTFATGALANAGPPFWVIT
jgi:hypothetical protein